MTNMSLGTMTRQTKPWEEYQIGSNWGVGAVHRAKLIHKPPEVD